MPDNNQQIQSQFGASADLYRSSRVHASGVDLQRIAELVAHHDRTQLALDVGCGAGHTTMAVAAHVNEITAFDLTENMLQQVLSLADERGIRNISTKQGTVETLPFEDNHFDIVVTRYSAHHWNKPLQAIAECHRVLKPGGLFIVSDVLGYESPQTDTILQAIELLRDKSHVRDYSLSEWQKMLETNGFEVSVEYTWQLDLVFVDWLKRMHVPEQKADMIRTIFSEVSDDIRETFHLDEHNNFALQGGLFKAQKH